MEQEWYEILLQGYEGMKDGIQEDEPPGLQASSTILGQVD